MSELMDKREAIADFVAQFMVKGVWSALIYKHLAQGKLEINKPFRDEYKQIIDRLKPINDWPKDTKPTETDLMVIFKSLVHTINGIVEGCNVDRPFTSREGKILFKGAGVILTFMEMGILGALFYRNHKKGLEMPHPLFLDVEMEIEQIATIDRSIGRLPHKTEVPSTNDLPLLFKCALDEINSIMALIEPVI